jgi:ABC-type polysaccharide/polyol phosphate export permease
MKTLILLIMVAFIPIWSGVLPASAQQVVLALPMVHGVEMLRHGWFGCRFHHLARR